MLHLDKVVILCFILCGMLAVYYIPVYVIVSTVIVFLILLYYDRKFNFSSVYVRGLARRNHLRRLLIYSRVWLDSAIISVMKTFHDIRAVSQRLSANGVAGHAEESSSCFMESSQGDYTSSVYAGVENDNFKYNTSNSFYAYTSTTEPNEHVSLNGRSFNSSQRPQSRTLSRHSRVSDLSFSPKGSPWGKSVSPKLRSHGNGVKTVQTVAGPLLASTRYNINLNSGLYGDANSPGFSSRVARYASENTKTLTHQKQYSGPGQFPLVQLDRSASQLPVLSSRKSQRIVHSPVTVRIAPPESSDSRFLSKSQILSGSSIQEEQSSKSVLEVLKEISRKRIHAQLDDSEDDDIIKRQRKIEGQNVLELTSENQKAQGDMAVGKRMREESPNHHELNTRPLLQQSKRTRNNEILSSLSSSRNLLNNLKTNKRKSSSSDWSRSSTPVMGKPPKQSRECIVEATSILKKTIEESSAATSTTNSSVVTTTPTSPTQQEEEKPVGSKPSEFLPKFAAVLNKSSGPVLNSVAALEAKRANDSKTRLRSMLAVIAGEDDFMRKQSSTSADEGSAASIPPVTTGFSSIFTPVSGVGEMATTKETTSAAETIVTSSTLSFPLAKSTADSVQIATSAETVPAKGLFTSTSLESAAVSTAPSTTGFNMLSSMTSIPVTSVLNQTSTNTSLTTSAMPGEQVKPISAVVSETSTNPSIITSAEEKTDLFKKSQILTASPITFNFGNSQSSNPLLVSSPTTVNALPKVSSSVSDTTAISSAPTVGISNGSPIISSAVLPTELGPLPGSRSNSDSSISSSSASTVIYVPKSTETTKNLFPFGNVSATTTSASVATLGSGLTSGTSFTQNNNQPSLGLFSSQTAAVGATSSALNTSFTASKSDDKQQGTLPATSAPTFGMSPSSGNSSIFQSNIVTSSSSSSVGGFKYDFSRNTFTSPTGSAQPIISPVATPLITTSTANTAPSTTTIITTTVVSTFTTTTPIIATSTPSPTVTTPSTTTANSSTTTTTTSQPFQFVSPASKQPAFNFSSMTNTNGPTQSTGGFPGPIFQAPQLPQTDGGNQKQVSFKFGTGSSQTSGFSFGGSSTTTAIKPSGFSFGGGGNLSSQTSSGIFGSTSNTTGQPAQPSGSMFGTGNNLTETSTQPVFGVSSNKTDQPQIGSGMFGNPSQPSSGGAFGTGSTTPSQPSQPAGGIFENVFRSGNNTPGQSQPSTGLFGTGSNASNQSLLPSTGTFGSANNQVTPQPSGLFGNNTGLSASTTQSSTNVFGSLTPQPSGGLFSSNANPSTPSTQASSGLFGNIGNAAVQTSQSSNNLFGNTTTQSSGSMFGTGSGATPQPSGGAFGSGVATQPSGGAFGSGAAAQPSGGAFGSGAAAQPSGGAFGSGAAAQPSGGAFGSGAAAQPSGGAFGSGAVAQPSGGAFGSGTATQPSGGAFGSSGNTQPVFGFGSTSTATPAQQTSSGATTGLFGTSSNLQTPFQFGASSNNASSTAPQPTGGFNFASPGVNSSVPSINFSAGTSSGNTAFQFGGGVAAPMFSGQPSGQGMFSIGSGSTAPRARATRMRRQK